jgi:hypothetical protein
MGYATRKPSPSAGVENIQPRRPDKVVDRSRGMWPPALGRASPKSGEARIWKSA